MTQITHSLHTESKPFNSTMLCFLDSSYVKEKDFLNLSPEIEKSVFFFYLGSILAHHESQLQDSTE